DSKLPIYLRRLPEGCFGPGWDLVDVQGKSWPIPSLDSGQLDLQGVPTGLYYLQVTIDGKSSSQLILKE
ncbi:MAG: T9SS type A sorting domain-containing protein, partial [Bacteroidota bacterium]